MLMDEAQLAWTAGLLEGEGSFSTYGSGNTPRIAASSTDKDVLEQLVFFAGGRIYPLKKRKSHWKDAWVWVLTCDEAVSLMQNLLPWLGKRRKQRVVECLQIVEETKNKRKAIQRQRSAKHAKVIELRESGMTHQAIADQVGYDRTYVTKLLNTAVVA